MDGIRGVGQGPAGSSLGQQLRFMLQAIRDVRAGRAGAEQERTETTLNYKLDMDERGVLKSAKPGDSIRAVTGQEQMNARRLSAEAMSRGEDVVSVDVDYKTAIVDGKLVIVAGHTEVTSKPRGGEPLGGGAYQVEEERAFPPVQAHEPDQASESQYRAIGEANRLASLSLSLLSPYERDDALRGFSEPE